MAQTDPNRYHFGKPRDSRWGRRFNIPLPAQFVTLSGVEFIPDRKGLRQSCIVTGTESKTDGPDTGSRLAHHDLSDPSGIRENRGSKTDATELFGLGLGLCAPGSPPRIRGCRLPSSGPGCGIGSLPTIRVYNLQGLGHDAMIPKVLLGRGAGEHKYGIAGANSLGYLDFGDGAVRLFTNSPGKVEILEKEELGVTSSDGTEVVNRFSTPTQFGIPGTVSCKSWVLQFLH